MNMIRSDSPLFQRTETKPAEPFVLDESKTETRYLPRSVKLTLPGHITRQFPAGIQEIPVQLLDDPWLVANGMTQYNAREPLPIQPKAPIGSHAYATDYAASGTYDATLIPNATFTDEVISAADANARAAGENVRIAQENLEQAVRVHQGAIKHLQDAQANRAADVEEAGGTTRQQPQPSNKKENATQRRAREKREEEFYDTLSDEDKAKWDDATQLERDEWIARSAGLE